MATKVLASVPEPAKINSCRGFKKAMGKNVTNEMSVRIITISDNEPDIMPMLAYIEFQVYDIVFIPLGIPNTTACGF